MISHHQTRALQQSSPISRVSPLLAPLSPLTSEQVAAMASLCRAGIAPLAAEILARRKESSTADVGFLTESLIPSLASDPTIAAAVETVAKLVRSGIATNCYVAGDFDVDGCCGIAILAKAFQRLGCSVRWGSPCRATEGYDFNQRLLNEAKAARSSLLVLVDFGSQQRALVNAAFEAGMRVIVIDHHTSRRSTSIAAQHSNHSLAEPDHLINPNIEQSSMHQAMRPMCAAGLAYLFAVALEKEFPERDIPLSELRGLAALATIADVVPLRGVNRELVQDLSLVRLNDGLNQLCRLAKIVGTPCVNDVAFRLAAIGNAPGRIAQRGADLFVSLLLGMDSPERIPNESLPDLMLSLNGARKSRERVDLARAFSAFSQRKAEELDAGLTFVSEKFDPGLAGLVAARAVDCFGRPAAVISLTTARGGRGSVRGVPGFDVFEALSACSDLLLRYGGHMAAGGFTISHDNIELFRRRFAAEALRQLGPHYRRTIIPDLSFDFAQFLVAKADVEAQLLALEPCGAGFPYPVIELRHARLSRILPLGDRHCKLEFTSTNSRLEAYLFNMNDHPVLLQRGKSFARLLVRASRGGFGGASASALYEFVGAE